MLYLFIYTEDCHGLLYDGRGGDKVVAFHVWNTNFYIFIFNYSVCGEGAVAK